jgi:hypothetical protein
MPIARESWAHAPSPTATVKAEISLSIAPQTFENRALVRSAPPPRRFKLLRCRAAAPPSEPRGLAARRVGAPLDRRRAPVPAGGSYPRKPSDPVPLASAVPLGRQRGCGTERPTSRAAGSWLAVLGLHTDPRPLAAAQGKRPAECWVIAAGRRGRGRTLVRRFAGEQFSKASSAFSAYWARDLPLQTLFVGPFVAVLVAVIMAFDRPLRWPRCGSTGTEQLAGCSVPSSVLGEGIGSRHQLMTSRNSLGLAGHLSLANDPSCRIYNAQARAFQ